jgi:hypothetical protein
MAETATVRLSHQGVRSGRGGISRAQRGQMVAETASSCPALRAFEVAGAA